MMFQDLLLESPYRKGEGLKMLICNLGINPLKIQLLLNEKWDFKWVFKSVICRKLYGLTRPHQIEIHIVVSYHFVFLWSMDDVLIG